MYIYTSRFHELLVDSKNKALVMKRLLRFVCARAHKICICTFACAYYIWHTHHAYKYYEGILLCRLTVSCMYARAHRRARALTHTHTHTHTHTCNHTHRRMRFIAMSFFTYHMHARKTNTHTTLHDCAQDAHTKAQRQQYIPCQ